MAIDMFIPEFWSARLKRHLDSRLVIAQPGIMNRNWEGEVRDAGDTVHIQRITTGGTIRDYVRDTNMAAPDRPAGETLALVVDQQKAFYIAVDDVNEVQSNVTLMDKFAERTARNLAVTLDTFAAGLLETGATAANKLGTKGSAPKVIKHNATTGEVTPYQFCVEARKALAKQNLPLEDLWMVINADLEAEFLQDPVYIETADREITRTGQIGRIAGFNVLRTEAIQKTPSTAAELYVPFGDGNYSLTWADQVVKVEAERLQGQFGDAVKGLQVFGAKVIEPESYGIAYVDNPAV